MYRQLYTGLLSSSRAKQPEMICDVYQDRLASAAERDHDSDTISDRIRVDPERKERMV